MNTIYDPHFARVANKSHAVLRGMSRADRDDAIADALLRAWQNIANYDSAKGSFDAYFLGHLLNAKRMILKHNKRQGESVHALNELIAAEDVETQIASEQAHNNILAGASDIEKIALKLIECGESVKSTMSGTGLSRERVQSLRRKFKRAYRHADTSVGRPKLIERASVQHQGGVDNLDAKIPVNKGCTCRGRCVNCAWFDGVTTGAHHSVDALAKGEIGEAIRSLADRKYALARYNSHRI